MTITPKSSYGFFAVAEMVTWTGLITAMIARYGFGYDGPLFFVAGLSHGVVFLGYAAAAVIVGINQRWRFGLGIAAIFSAIVPYATLPFDRFLHKRHLLDGSWRYEETDYPGDKNPIDRLFRWFLRHPVIMTLTVSGLLGGMLVGLLLLGSPTEWGGE
jgi:integral membrane protein